MIQCGARPRSLALREASRSRQRSSTFARILKSSSFGRGGRDAGPLQHLDFALLRAELSAHAGDLVPNPKLHGAERRVKRESPAVGPLREEVNPRNAPDSLRYCSVLSASDVNDRNSQEQKAAADVLLMSFNPSSGPTHS